MPSPTVVTFAPRARDSAPEIHLFFGAGHEIRTRDPELGKLVLYQLS
jgi:hypothetical protein